MLDHSAERSFRKGMDLVGAGGYRDALGYFSGAIEIDRAARPDETVESRYLSYYGLCLCVARVDKRSGLKHCRAAARREPYNADFWGNLGRVALLNGRRREAHRALEKGLRLEPDHAGIRRSLKGMGSRRPPVLRFLARGNPLNIMLGRVRARRELRRRAHRPKSRRAADGPVTLEDRFA